MSKLQKLPIGIQTFSQIREDNYIYIDKTDIAYKMLESYKYVFLSFYASVIYVYLQSLGLDIIGEDITNKSRIDLTIKMNNAIYILEFKVGDDDPLQQIKDKEYATKYLNDNKDIYLIGINFDEKEKNISKFEWERV